MTKKIIESYEKITSLEFLIVKNIFMSSGKLDSFTLFKKIRVPFSLFERSLRSLESKNIIEMDSLMIKLSQGANAYILKNISKRGVYHKKWRDIPLENKVIPISINHKYVPSIRLLDKKKFLI